MALFTPVYYRTNLLESEAAHMTPLLIIHPLLTSLKAWLIAVCPQLITRKMACSVT